jgi:hypothetical protein
MVSGVAGKLEGIPVSKGDNKLLKYLLILKGKRVTVDC